MLNSSSFWRLEFILQVDVYCHESFPAARTVFRKVKIVYIVKKFMKTKKRLTLSLGLGIRVSSVVKVMFKIRL